MGLEKLPRCRRRDCMETLLGVALATKPGLPGSGLASRIRVPLSRIHQSLFLPALGGVAGFHPSPLAGRLWQSGFPMYTPFPRLPERCICRWSRGFQGLVVIGNGVLGKLQASLTVLLGLENFPHPFNW